MNNMETKFVYEVIDSDKLNFIRTEDENFSCKLLLIDSFMEIILSEMLLYFYYNGDCNCYNAITYVEQSNPLNYTRFGMYTYKFRQFLYAYAIDNNILDNNLYRKCEYEKYLLDNAYFDKDLLFEIIYDEDKDNRLFIKINMEIKFYRV